MTSYPIAFSNQAPLSFDLRPIDIDNSRGKNLKTRTKNAASVSVSVDTPANKGAAILRSVLCHAKEILKDAPVSAGNEFTAQRKNLKSLIAMAEKKLSEMAQADHHSRQDMPKAASVETLSMLQLANEIQQVFSSPPNVKPGMAAPGTTDDLPVAACARYAGGMNSQSVDLDSLLCELERLQHDTAQKRVESQQAVIKANRDTRGAQFDQKIKIMADASKARADRLAAEGKQSIWSKVSNAFGILAAVLGIALAPLTGGLSLIATAYLVVDLALELGEYFSGIKMSIQSGVQIACEKIINAIPLGTAGEREMAAIIASATLNIAISVVATVLSAGAAGPKLFTTVSKLSAGLRALKCAPKTAGTINRGAQFVTQATNGAVSIYSGECGIETANAGYALTSSEVQKMEIDKLQTWLQKLMEQCTEDLKLIAKELQRNSELLADILSSGIEHRKATINGLFGRQGVAA